MRIIAASLGVLLTGACATVTTTQVRGTDQPTGLRYALPVQFATVTLERKIEKVSSLEGLLSRRAKLDGELKTASDAFASAKKISERADEILKAAKANGLNTGPVYDELVETVAKTGEAYTTALESFCLFGEDPDKPIAECAPYFSEYCDDDGTAIPDCTPGETKWRAVYIGLIADIKNASGDKPDPDKWKSREPKDTLTVQIHDPIGDTRSGLVLDFPHNWLQSDEHKFKISNTGLLQTANIETTDQTQSLLIAVSSLSAISGYDFPDAVLPDPSAAVGGADRGDDLAAEISALAAATQELIDVLKVPVSTCVGAGSPMYKGVTKPEFQLSYGAFVHQDVMDPTNPVAIKTFNKAACDLGSNLRLRVRALGRPRSIGAPPVTPIRLIENKPVRGIAYRIPVAYEVQITEYVSHPDKSVFPLLRDSRRYDLPNNGPIAFIDQKRTLFGSRSTGIGFDDGVPVSLDINRPSEIKSASDAVVETIKTPFELIKTVATLQLESGRAEKETALGAIAIEEKRLEFADKVLQSGRTNDLAALKNAIEIQQLGLTRDLEDALKIAQLQQKLALESTTNDAAVAAQLAQLSISQRQALEEEIKADVLSATRASEILNAENEAQRDILSVLIEIQRKQSELEELLRSAD